MGQRNGFDVFVYISVTRLQVEIQLDSEVGTGRLTKSRACVSCHVQVLVRQKLPPTNAQTQVMTRVEEVNVRQPLNAE